MIGLSVIFQYRAPEFLALASELKRVLPQVHITTGGHFPTFTARELLRDNPALDSVVCGEGEYTLLELVQQIDAPETWDTIQGLSFRRDSRIHDNPPRPLIANLDSLPFPVRDTAPQVHLGIGYTPIVGSRGCYRDCAFCSIHAFYGASPGKIQRFRSVPNLVDEMELLYHTFGVRFYVFNDDEWFPGGKARLARVDALERELRRRDLDVMMSIKCRADDVEEGLFRRLLDMGVMRAYVGIESGSDHSLATLNKHTTVAQNRNALETLHRVGMLADFGMIFFDPDSTVEDVRANLDFFHEMAGAGQAPLSFGRMEVYAGTAIQARLQQEGRLTGSYLAWNYVIPDPRVELLFRLMIATMWRRHYESDGLAKLCSVACYELTMYQYLLRERADRRPDGRGASRSSPRVNNHSLALLEEMFDFVSPREHLRRAAGERSGRGRGPVASTIFDFEVGQELAQAARPDFAGCLCGLQEGAMIPWQKLPKDLQRTILAIVVLSGEAAAASSCRPMVCDPAPPPRTSPYADDDTDVHGDAHDLRPGAAAHDHAAPTSRP